MSQTLIDETDCVTADAESLRRDPLVCFSRRAICDGNTLDQLKRYQPRHHRTGSLSDNPLSGPVRTLKFDRAKNCLEYADTKLLYDPENNHLVFADTRELATHPKLLALNKLLTQPLRGTCDVKRQRQEELEATAAAAWRERQLSPRPRQFMDNPKPRRYADSTCPPTKRKGTTQAERNDRYQRKNRHRSLSVWRNDESKSAFDAVHEPYVPRRDPFSREERVKEIVKTPPYPTQQLIDWLLDHGFCPSSALAFNNHPLVSLGNPDRRRGYAAGNYSVDDDIDDDNSKAPSTNRPGYMLGHISRYLGYSRMPGDSTHPYIEPAETTRSHVGIAPPRKLFEAILKTKKWHPDIKEAVRRFIFRYSSAEEIRHGTGVKIGTTYKYVARILQEAKKLAPAYWQAERQEADRTRVHRWIHEDPIEIIPIRSFP